MNLLAHLYLADTTPESMLGNVLADFLKGPDLQRLPAGFQAGVRMHRQIDGFTDRHLVMQRSLTRISARWGWFAGIIMDVYYDHLLSRDWSQYYSRPLREFVDQFHQILSQYVPSLPKDLQEYAHGLLENDRLASYDDLDTVAQVLRWLSRRIRERMPRHSVHLEDAIPDLLQVHDDLRSDFHCFFPDVIAFARSLILQQRANSRD